MREYGREIVRYGRFAVLDRGEAQSANEAKQDRPRYAVVEYDQLGPILRCGPYRDLTLAIEQCQAMAFRFDLSEPQEVDHA
jgi:hypothetical protein